MRARLVRALLALACLGAVVGGARAEPPAAEPIDVAVRRIERFKIGSDQTRFGPLEFLGGLEMSARSARFGGFSAIRFLSPGADFIGVADLGYWFFGRIGRDAAGAPASVEAFSMQPMVDAKGRVLDQKLDADAEGLDAQDGIATVGYERHHRVTQFRIAPGRMGRPLRDLAFLIPRRELRLNSGFETVTHTPRGERVIVTERSLDKHGNCFAAVLEGPRKGIFTVKRIGDYDITDGAFLPDGDLLLLERRFSFPAGPGMRLRRVPGDLVRKGALADGPILLEADMGEQIDNMEGLDVWRRADGATMVSIISDDNHSIWQRSIYLEFRLVE